jgi:hypothetical protein
MKEFSAGEMAVKSREAAHVKNAEVMRSRKTQGGFSRVTDDQKLRLAQSALTEFSERFHDISRARDTRETQGIAEFVLQNIDCLKCGHSYVLFVNQDWHGFAGELHPVHEALIGSKQTKVVALEYFNPELYVNARNVPLVGMVAHWLWKRRYYQDSDRIRYAKALETTCAKHRKLIAVVDIAQNTNYSLNFYLSYLASIVGGSASLLSLLPDHRTVLVLACLFLYHRFDTGIRRVGKKIGKNLSLGGMFDPEQVHWYEKFFLDLEDGRRILGTSGVRQLVSEYPSNRAEEPSYIVVNVPPAHGIRYALNLLDPTRADTWARKVKQVMYGLVPNISPTVRTWTYKHGICPISEDSSQGTWALVSKRRVKLLQ